MAKTPQSFAKRQRERQKQQKREEKLERRLIRNAEKKIAKLEAEGGDVEELRARLARKWDDEEYY
jgi:hypothetical protein